MKKPWYKKWWVWGIVIIVLAGVFGSSEETPEVISSSQTATPENSSGKLEVKESYIIGEEVKLGETTIVVNSVEKSAGTEWDKPKSGNEYVIVSVTIRNVGQQEIFYNPYNFSMINSQGQITDMAFTTVDSDTALSSGSLASGGTVSGTISFEQPIEDSNLVLKYAPNIFSDKEIKFNLN